MAQEHAQVFVHVFGVAENGAADYTALAVDVLGCGIDDDIGAQLVGLLQDRRGKNIIHDQPSARLVRQLSHGGKIDDLQARV